MSIYLFLLLHPVIYFIQSVKAGLEPENARMSTNGLIKLDNVMKSQRRAESEASVPIPRYAAHSFSWLVTQGSLRCDCCERWPRGLPRTWCVSPIQSRPRLLLWRLCSPSHPKQALKTVLPAIGHVSLLNFLLVVPSLMVTIWGSFKLSVCSCSLLLTLHCHVNTSQLIHCTSGI